MKKILIGIFAVALAIPAMAQKGGVTIGGSFDALMKKDYTAVAITPEIGYKVLDNLAVGLDLGFGSINDKTSGLKDQTSMFGVGVFGRYSFPLADKVSFALKASVGYSSLTSKNDGQKSLGSPMNTIGIEVAPELWFNLTKTTSLWLSVGSIGYFNTKPKDGDSQSAFNLSWNSSPLLDYGVEDAFSGPSFGVAFAF